LRVRAFNPPAIKRKKPVQSAQNRIHFSPSFAVGFSVMDSTGSTTWNDLPLARRLEVVLTSAEKMPDDFYLERDDAEAEEPERWDDPVVDDAKDELRRFFARNPEKVFYQRQLQVIFERTFFHWITARALAELAEEKSIASDVLPFAPTGSITIYRATTHRYWKRQAEEIKRIVARFSDDSFTQALGNHGELMFEAALPTADFIPKGKKVRSYKGKEWTETRHDLDRIFERDGIAYGAEVKNTLGYISREELRVKIRMCAHLGIRPLFIVRMAPKSYIHEVHQAGGYTLVFKYHLYPFG
jgi:hypothetical protein